jgi:hypothetical protein
VETAVEVDDLELGEWVRVEQSHGDYVFVRGSMVIGVGEAGGESGAIKQYITMLNSMVYPTSEEPKALVKRIRTAVAAERKLTR